MGTKSTTKILTQNAGTITEVAALTTSTGAADKQAIVATNDSGFIDPTLLNAKATSAGASDAGKPVLTNASGKIDDTLLPASVGGTDSRVMTFSEAVAAGDFVNIWSDSGTGKARKADGSVAGKKAMGFVKAAVASGATGTVYFEGTNDQVTGATPGDVFLGVTAGKFQAAAPTGAGQTVQNIGYALSATEINFQSNLAITLAS